MKMLSIKPDIFCFDKAAEFVREFRIGSGDLIITNEYIYQPYFKELNPGADVIFQEKFGKGEPSDDMVEAMYREISGKQYRRIIGIGGGTIIDISKLFSLRQCSPVADLYDGVIPAVKDKKLILVPTTCGTGSEVTNIAILALNSRGTKKGLAEDAMYADHAVLIPELLTGLPFRFFATSSIDALIHAAESALSPRANAVTKMFSYRAIEMILSGYQKIAEQGPEARIPLLADFLQASNLAGIAFSNAGCAAVHALSYPLGASYHVPHGESNYAVFTGVMKNYMEVRKDGEIDVLNQYLAGFLGCEKSQVHEELEKLLNHILQKKALHEYGVKKEELPAFTDSVLENQQRLLVNSFVPLDRERILKIYREIY